MAWSSGISDKSLDGKEILVTQSMEDAAMRVAREICSDSEDDLWLVGMLPFERIYSAMFAKSPMELDRLESQAVADRCRTWHIVEIENHIFL